MRKLRMMKTTLRNETWFYTFMALMCLNSFFLGGTGAQVDSQLAAESGGTNHTFETIDVPGIEFLELTASSEFGDYAGNTRSADGERTIGFTLIDGVFTTYDFPGSQNTYFYTLGNSGIAAGYYQDSDGFHHGVVLENGVLRQYDFPGAIQTESTVLVMRPGY